ncbi:hypothetical protein GCM10023148_31710 [Actinokineospora soli]
MSGFGAGQGNQDVKEQVVHQAIARLRAAAVDVADAVGGMVRTQPAGPVFGMTTVGEVNDFLTGLGVAWYHTGGYAMLCWCRHYGLAETETEDLDIMVQDSDYPRAHKALYGVEPEKLEAKPTIGGYAISLHSYSGEPAFHVVDGVPLVAATTLAKNYARHGGGAMSLADVLRSRTGAGAEKTVESRAKEERRERRAAVMEDLLRRYHEDFG